MFIPVQARAASAYKRVSVDTSVESSDPHHLIELLFEGFFSATTEARGAMARNDVALKGRAISRAVAIISDGLKGGLDVQRGGELAQNLSSLYDYCVMRLTQANLRNDESLIQEVVGLIQPLAEAWKQIRPQTTRGPSDGV